MYLYLNFLGKAEFLKYELSISYDKFMHVALIIHNV